MVAHVCDPFAVDRVLHIEPDLLIEHEQDKVVEEGCHVGGAQGVIATTSDNDRVVAGQESHRVAEARRGRRALTLYLNEFTVHNLTIDHHRLEVSKLVLELAFLILAAKEVDPLMH